MSPKIAATHAHVQGLHKEAVGIAFDCQAIVDAVRVPGRIHRVTDARAKHATAHNFALGGGDSVPVDDCGERVCIDTTIVRIDVFVARLELLQRGLEEASNELERFVEKPVTVSLGQVLSDRHVSAELERADVILLFISPDFIDSDYCYEREMKRALERHALAEATVIPVILRPCDWHPLPFGSILAAPTDGKPITRWPDQDEAFLDVATAVRKALAARSPQAKAGPSPSGPDAPPAPHAPPVARPRSSNAVPQLLASRNPAVVPSVNQALTLHRTEACLKAIAKGFVLVRIREENGRQRALWRGGMSYTEPWTGTP